MLGSLASGDWPKDYDRGCDSSVLHYCVYYYLSVCFGGQGLLAAVSVRFNVSHFCYDCIFGHRVWDRRDVFS